VSFDENGMLTAKGKALVQQQRKIVEGAGLKPSAVGGSWVPDWNQCIKPHIQAAALLGSEFLYGPFATPFLLFPEDTPAGGDSAEWGRLQAAKFAELLQDKIGPFAAKHGVVLCEEPLQRFERMPIHLKEATDLALNANIDQFKVMVDMCHEAADGGGPKVYAGLIDKLFKAGKFQGVHVSPVHRGKLYESWFNQEYFNDFFGPIFKHGYKGEISIETFDAIDPVVTPAKINRDPFKHPVGVMINQLVYTTTMLKNIK
jgi:sugar phosphate isomerase/epimerase